MNVKAMLVLGAVTLFGALPLDASQRLRVRAVPNSSADLTIYVGVERHAENRMLRVTAESDDFFRSTELQLDGESSPRITVIHFHQLPTGWYDVTAQLVVDTGRTTDRPTCTVIVF